MALVKQLTALERAPWGWFEPIAGLVAKLVGGPDRARAKLFAQAIIGHPIYRAPHNFEPVAPASSQLNANFNHFLAQRSDRVAHARFFLTVFHVDLSEVASVETWLAAYGPLLLAPHADGTVSSSLTQTCPPQTWPRTTGGLNVVLDLAVALGESAIACDARWHWEGDASAWGTFVCLTDGVERVDLVSALAACCRTPGELAKLRTRFGVATLL